MTITYLKKSPKTSSTDDTKNTPLPQHPNGSFKTAGTVGRVNILSEGFF